MVRPLLFGRSARRIDDGGRDYHGGTSMQVKVLMRYLALCALPLIGLQAHAAVIHATDLGHYEASGMHDPSSTNYAVGTAPGFEFNNFFVFDLTAYHAISSAVLQVYLLGDSETPTPPVTIFPAGGYISHDSAETWDLFDVGTDIGTLVGGTGGVSAFDDLGSGTAFGSVVITAADEGSQVEVALNTAALASLNAANGLWAIGGALSTATPGIVNFVFGYSHLPPSSAQLIVQEADIPLPTTPWLLGIGLLILSTVKRNAG